MYQNNPNPFTENTAILATVPEGADAQICIYNLQGKQLMSKDLQASGTCSVTVAANELHAGMFLYSLIVNGKLVDTKTMVITE